MSFRYLAGYITASYNPLKVPNAPTLGTVTPGNSQVTVAFTAPTNVGGGAITSYVAIVQDTSTGATFTNTGSSSPITVTGLTNGQTYNVKVAAINNYGLGPFSAPSANFSYAPKLYAWGTNTDGRTGLNIASTASRSSPVQVGAETNWASIRTSGNVSGAIKTDGTLWSWGLNDFGQLGHGNTTNRSSPVQIGALTTWTQVACGSSNMAAVKNDGTLWVWGRNLDGQLGQNDRVDRNSPVQVGADTNWAQVSIANLTTIAVKTNGTLWSWGSNSFGLLGQNIATTVSRSSPVQVGALTNWGYTDKLFWGTRIIKTDGTMWTWGNNSSGVLGLNDTVARSSPVQIGALTTWASVSGGGAIKTDGTLWVWGEGTSGQLMTNNTINRSSPVQVGTDTNWAKFAYGNAFSLALRTDNTLWSAGSNSGGVLGINASAVTLRSSPTQIGALNTWLDIAASEAAFAILS